jgi:hypothetical protein
MSNQHDGKKRTVHPRFKNHAYTGKLADGSTVHKTLGSFTQHELQLALQLGSKRMRELIQGPMPAPYKQDNASGEPVPTNKKTNAAKNKNKDTEKGA